MGGSPTDQVTAPPGADLEHSTPQQLAEALVATDVILVKAATKDPTAPFVALEARLFKTLVRAYTKAARVAVRDATDRAGQGDPDGRPTRADVEAVKQRVDRAFQNWDAGTEHIVEAVLRASYREAKVQAAARANAHPNNRVVRPVSPHLTFDDVRKAKGKPRTTFEIKPRFSVVDDAAVESMKTHQTYWIGQHHAKNVSNKIATIAEDTMLKQGLSRREAAKALEASLKAEFGYDPKQPFGTAGTFGIPGKWNGSPIQYFEGVAANATTTARIAGKVQEYKEVGASLIEVIAAQDERTCEVCGFMDKKVFTLQQADTQVTELQGASEPNSVKLIQPWSRLKQINKDSLTTSKDTGRVAPHKAQALAKTGHCLPTYHFRCRCDIDIAEDATFKPYEEIPDAPEPAKPAEPPVTIPPKPPVAGQPLSAPLPKKPPPPPKPQPIKPPPDRPPDAFPFEESQMKDLGRQGLDGMHSKSVYEAPDGTRWLFKPQSEFRARGDVLAADMAKALGLETPDVYMTRLGGKVGSIQKMYTNVVSDYGSIAPSSLSATECSIIQRQHLFDWLISQHDTHSGNLIKLTNGHTVFIDKGQTFRFFGKDKLTLGYGASGTPNPSSTYYHTMFQSAIKGDAVQLAEINHRRIQGFLKAVDDMSDEAFANIIRPYALAAEKAYKEGAVRMGFSGQFWMKDLSADEFIAQAAARKRALRKEAEKFYKVLEKKLHPPVPKAPTVSIAAPEVSMPPGAVQQLDDVLVREIIESKWAGKAVMVGGSDFEEMQLLAYQVKGEGFLMEGKLRQGSMRKLEKVMQDPPRGYSVRRFREMPVRRREFNFTTREIEWTGETSSSLRRAAMTWEIKTPSGIEIEYTPFIAENTKNHFSASGQFVMRLPKAKGAADVTITEVKAMLGELKSLGLNSQIATADDIDLLYLRLVAENKGLGKRAAKVRETLTPATQKKKLRDLLSENNVPLTKERGFSSVPKFDHGTKFGRAYWEAPVTQAEEEFYQSHKLVHTITGTSKRISESLDKILSGTEGLIATEEKIRAGIGIAGMSPTADRASGGAVNVFTRIRKIKKGTGYGANSVGDMGNSYVLNPRKTMRKTTTFSYEGDRYGSMKTRARNTRLFNARDWAASADNYGNETTVRNFVDFSDALESVVVPNLQEKQEVLAVLRKHGIKKLGDRKIEQAITIVGRPLFE